MSSTIEAATRAHDALRGGIDATSVILVVDDSTADRHSTATLLRSRTRRVLEAAGGADALQVVRAEHPDVVIADVLMPSMDGYEFARQLRADNSIARTPIIFHTGVYEYDEVCSLARACGVSQILTKPTKRGDFLKAIEAARTEAALTGKVVVPEEEFESEHRRLLSDKLAEKVAQLQAALSESRNKETQLLRTMKETIKTEQALEESNRDLLRKNQEIRNFYHTVSHELKTPLTSAREFISILMDGLAGPLDETQRGYLAIARDSCDRLRICIDDLMDATRLETGKLSIDLKSGSLLAVIRQLITILGPVAARKQITVEHDVSIDLPDFPFDANRIMQVLVNLVNNALKFTPENGSVTISASESEDHPGFIQVCVKDTGCGISLEERERIFERLYQVPQPDGGTTQGVGLGLFICRELVHAHGGEIWVESELGRGSTFCFIIPREPASEALRVLVVDDDPRMRELMERVLARRGFQVATAEDGAVALEKMRKELPEVVVTDLQMPKTNGVEMLKEIRQTWGLLPVIILTGFPDADIMRRALEFSPFTLLAKPCPTEQLIDTICSLRQRKSSRPRRARADQSSHGTGLAHQVA